MALILLPCGRRERGALAKEAYATTWRQGRQQARAAERAPHIPGARAWREHQSLRGGRCAHDDPGTIRSWRTLTRGTRRFTEAECRQPRGRRPQEQPWRYRKSAGRKRTAGSRKSKSSGGSARAADRARAAQRESAAPVHAQVAGRARDQCAQDQCAQDQCAQDRVRLEAVLAVALALVALPPQPPEPPQPRAALVARRRAVKRKNEMMGPVDEMNSGSVDLGDEEAILGDEDLDEEP